MKKPLYYSLIANTMIPIAGISTDIYLPSLPAITQHFGVDKSLAQYTVAAFIFAMGFIQFFAGPISDSKGRKPIILSALITQLAAVIGILFSTNIYSMIAFRFIQGVGAAFMIVPARAIINDLFEGEALKKQLYYITISFALGPVLGPFIGGYLQHYFGWKANFLFLLGFITIVLVIVSLTIKETISEKSQFSLHHFWKNPATIIKNRFFTSCTLMSGTIYAYAMVFNIAGPFVIQTVLGESPIVYGHIALLNGIAWFLGSLLNRFTIHVSYDLESKIHAVDLAGYQQHDVGAKHSGIFFFVGVCSTGYFIVVLQQYGVFYSRSSSVAFISENGGIS